MSIRPTAGASARAAFVGTIPLDHGFSPLVRDLLLSRIGPDPVQLAGLVQIARIPTEHESQTSPQLQLIALTNQLTSMSGDTLDRGVLDSFVSQMGGLLEQFGFAAAPKWPAISVIPLALYRNVLPVPGPDDDEHDLHT